MCKICSRETQVFNFFFLFFFFSFFFFLFIFFLFFVVLHLLTASDLSDNQNRKRAAQRILEALLNAGSEISARNLDGATPIHLAAAAGNHFFFVCIFFL